MNGLRGDLNEDEFGYELGKGLEYLKSMGRNTKYGVWNMQSDGLEKMGSRNRVGDGHDSDQSEEDGVVNEKFESELVTIS